MKKIIFLVAMLISSTVFAATEHYFLRDGNHVYHLKVTERNSEYTVHADVNFEPNDDEKGKRVCAAEIAGEAKVVGKNELVLKKHSESSASFCELKITLTDSGAKIERLNGCKEFATGICHFGSDSKELKKVQ